MSPKILVLFCGVALATSASPKIASSLHSILTSKESSNIIISFQQNTAPILNKLETLQFDSRSAKITFLKQQLNHVRESSQAKAISLVESHGFRYRSFWVNNKLFVRKATPEIISKLSELPEVTLIREEIVSPLDKKFGPETKNEPYWPIDPIQWNILQVEANQAWELEGGNTGEGVVVGTIDSGARLSHEALVDSYRAEYGWYDPYRGVTVPEDITGFGSHATGLVSGAGGIGVAPGSQWIHCRACPEYSCFEEYLLACGEWMTCPTLADGSESDCSKAPHITSNTFSIITDDYSDLYEEVVAAWRSAGIIPIFEQGTSGSTCGSGRSPGAYPNVISVGGTDNREEIDANSGRGPSKKDNSTIKPDFVAPGRRVMSASGRGDMTYWDLDGTHTAAPHAAGVVALILSHNQNLTYDQVKKVLEVGTDQETLGIALPCGGVGNNVFPNNVFGHGRVNARKALQTAIEGRF